MKIQKAQDVRVVDEVHSVWILKSWRPKCRKRYEIFQLPEAVKVLFDRPQQERAWTSLAALAKYVVDAANGVVTVKIAGANVAEELHGAVLLGEQRSDLGFQGQLVIGSQVFHPGVVC